MTVHTYDDVVCITSKYRHGVDQWWWTVKNTDDVLYATFETRHPDRLIRERAVLAADTSSTNAVAMTSQGINQVPWVSPYEPAFIAPSDISIVRRADLFVRHKIKLGVDVVEYEGRKYIHKYMTASSTRYSFEVEIQNYSRTLDSPFVPKLHYIVTHREENRGFLIEFIHSSALDEAQLTVPERYSATKSLLEAVTDLEKRGYYPVDLKCSNLLLDKNQKVYVIDLGVGFTPGMYRPEAEEHIMRGGINGREMLYMLGRTLWQLWDDEFSPELRVPAEGMLPQVIEKMVQDCCSC